MSAMSFARNAFRTEKPHSSITDWVEVLTGPSIEDEAYDGIPELVDAINLQGTTGTGEASRAIRKKLKHGNAHQQYRGLVILKALVENCGHKFQTSFADQQLKDALMRLVANPDMNVEKRVTKKTMLVLLSWQDQFKDDPSMAAVAGLYQQCKHDKKRIVEIQEIMGFDPPDVIAKRREKEAEKEAKRQKRAEEAQRRAAERERRSRPRFDFDKEKPKILSNIAEASTASSNLINAMTLVNREKESLESNERVQDCLGKAKLVRKQIIRYIQLVENEEVIGTLIESNDRIMGALEMYDQLAAADTDPSALSLGMANLKVGSDGEVGKLQQRQRAAIERHASQQRINTGAHPDLEDLNFDTSGLPAPMKPTNTTSPKSPIEEEYNARGSLSDYSDYTSDEEDHKAHRSGKRDYVGATGDSDEEGHGTGLTSTKDNDPFADPFADDVAIGPSRK